VANRSYLRTIEPCGRQNWVCQNGLNNASAFEKLEFVARVVLKELTLGLRREASCWRSRCLSAKRPNCMALTERSE
jgi:hypothetical protein